MAEAVAARSASHSFYLVGGGNCDLFGQLRVTNSKNAIMTILETDAQADSHKDTHTHTRDKFNSSWRSSENYNGN